MKNHKYADLFPMIEGEALDALVADIREHGQRESIVLFDDKILDGRNRWRACKIAKLEPKTKVFRGTEEAALALVVSLNLKRRHLDESQRSMVSARIANLKVGANQHKEGSSIELPSVSQAAAAEQCNTSVASLKRAAIVIRDAEPELVAAVDAGQIPVSVAAKLVDRPASEQREIVAKVASGAKPAHVLAEAQRGARVDKLAAISAGNAPLTSAQRYPIILTDPPWRYEDPGSESRAIENHYPTMELADICALPVGDIATDDCVLFMWTTSPKLEESLRVIAAWGFTYRTCAVWDKEKIGMGYFFRQQHELLLVAKKGSPPHPAPADRVSSVLRVKRGKHSEKPVESYEMIEAMYPTLPKIEMFCRSPRAGWAAWGNQSAAAE